MKLSERFEGVQKGVSVSRARGNAQTGTYGSRDGREERRRRRLLRNTPFTPFLLFLPFLLVERDPSHPLSTLRVSGRIPLSTPHLHERRKKNNGSFFFTGIYALSEKTQNFLSIISHLLTRRFRSKQSPSQPTSPTTEHADPVKEAAPTPVVVEEESGEFFTSLLSFSLPISSLRYYPLFSSTNDVL